jgi:hypothetical protein
LPSAPPTWPAGRTTRATWRSSWCCWSSGADGRRLAGRRGQAHRAWARCCTRCSPARASCCWWAAC